LRECALAIGTCLTLLATQPVFAGAADQSAPPVTETEIESKISFLTDLASRTQDQAFRQQLQQIIRSEWLALEQLDRKTEWQTYRDCLAMRESNNAFDGNGGTLKFIRQYKNSLRAQEKLMGINEIYGGVPDAANATLSATTGEANGEAQDQVIDIAKDLTEGGEISELLGKLSSVLSIFDGGMQLYNVAKATHVGISAINQRDAADAALTDCKKPSQPEHPELAQGTPYLNPFPPGPPPKNPPTPPHRPAPKQPPPQKPIPLSQFLQQALGASGHGG
jgi:hypothetical protein